MNPFIEEKYPLPEELSILNLAKQGDSKAIEKILKAHQALIYNVILRMVYDPDQAADITQDILIKVMQELPSFRGESRLGTWIYRIAVNHALRIKKTEAETMITDFTQYGKDLDSIENTRFTQKKVEAIERKLLIEEAKIGCMMGMLLCLNREQRIVFILGEIFSVSDAIGSELLKISRANFRKKLSRARKDLYQFMNEKCGLVNKKNPCRCSRKTKGFIRLGIVNPKELKFSERSLANIKTYAPKKSDDFDEYIEPKYAELYRNHKFLIPPNLIKNIRSMFQDRKFREIFNLLQEDEIDGADPR
ncbi:RNA polymerase sigma factor [Leptospira sp. WS92.C1]